MLTLLHPCFLIESRMWFFWGLIPRQCKLVFGIPMRFFLLLLMKRSLLLLLPGLQPSRRFLLRVFGSKIYFPQPFSCQNVLFVLCALFQTEHKMVFFLSLLLILISYPFLQKLLLASLICWVLGNH